MYVFDSWKIEQLCGGVTVNPGCVLGTRWLPETALYRNSDRTRDKMSSSTEPDDD